MSFSENYCFQRDFLGLGQCRTSIKGIPAFHSLIHSTALLLLWKQCGPTPLGSSCNEPCVRQCQDSTIFIQPSPVVVTLPGPILSSFPQNTTVGSSTSAAVGSILNSQGVPISSRGFDLSCITRRPWNRVC
uniref:LOW QUALITY PROTEIN: feather keratin Cos1-2-like n=1 Tax=Agelaius phoeniceus TaxID=39638 RepID=UPI0023ED0CF2|nr:LOW QUALITY PROTEIN: feather keratin Cos1-2-like [Agelaius phoeniceus]